jgi:protein-tyrosine phosphatase
MTFLINNRNRKNFDFEYRYSTYDEHSRTAVWEREPNRCLHILTELNDDNSLNIKNNPDEYKLLTNSFLQVLDVNFVADFIFNKMGEKNIYIGPYPQNKDDLIALSKNNINSILNVQSDGDLKYRQINLEQLKSQSKELGIELIHYPINDFDSNDLLNKLKGAGDLLNELLKNGRTVYVHCTAGMSRAAATVIIYLVLYEDFNVETAKNFCKKYRPVICPNYDVINKIAKIFKPGSEMLDKVNSNTNLNEAWKKLREISGSPIKGNNNKDDDEYGLLKPIKYSSCKENIKLRKTKSRKKIKRPKSILKQHSCRKESSHELRFQTGLTRSITFILDDDWDIRAKRKESEQLRTRSKLNLEKKEIDNLKKNLMLD